MISEILIKNNKYLPFKYIDNLTSFKNNTKYKFKKGVNIIIGENGCGKSTLINLIGNYTFCIESHVSTFSPNTFNKLFNLNNLLLDGIEIKADYKNSFFKTYKSKGNVNNLNNIKNFIQTFEDNNSSDGEITLFEIEHLFNIMFSKETNFNFIIKYLEEIKKIYKDTNNEIKIDKLLNYYKENSIETNKRIFTVLLDEPDKNLDIMNIQQIYNFLSLNRKDTQIICVLHNPLLISKLSKIKHVNIIEMSKGYLNKINDFIKNI